MDTPRIFAIACLLIFACASRGAGATFVVNTTADAGDFDLRDGVADSDPDTPGQQITLRCAIENANLTPEMDEIHFDFSAADPGRRYYKDDSAAGGVNLAGAAATMAADDSAIADIDPDHPHAWWAIVLTKALPEITAPLLIDGYTQRGARPGTKYIDMDTLLRVEVDGSDASAAAVTSMISGGQPEVSGLRVRADGCVIRGLVITRFSNNLSAGVDIEGANNAVEGCFIGVEPSGLRAKPNFIGVRVSNLAGRAAAVAGNRIGVIGQNEDAFAERNLIGGNYHAGVTIAGDVAATAVAGNLIGADRTSNGKIPNGHGVQILGVASGNRVGGVKFIEGNLIAFNRKDGVNISALDEREGADNAILANNIHSNGGIGINLARPPEITNDVTPNDRGDVDEGPNHLQNFPELIWARTSSRLSFFKSARVTTIKGALKSNPNTEYRVEFFVNDVGDPTGHGEGMTYVGFVNVNTGRTHIADLEFTVPARVWDGYAISATATEIGADGTFKSTSEFAANVLVVDRMPAWLWLIALAVIIVAIGVIIIVRHRRRPRVRAMPAPAPAT